MKLEADYVIVGAGSSGCTLAYRLTEAGARVIVIEFGGSDWGPFIQMPAALSYPMNMRRYDWGFQSEPEPGLNGRRLVCPRGKVIGGSSSINGMVYVRGHAKDYDHWQSAGAKGWSYADVLPYFKRMENWQQGAHEGDIDWRGQMGPLYIERGKQLNPLYKAFIEAGKQAGYPVTQDYNGKQQEGFGVMEHTIWQGRRWSCANAYLRPALKTGRCKVIHALAHQVVFDSNSMPNATPKAVGVLISQGSVQRTIYAQQEVILSASSINSPKLLMLSGIGDSTALKQLGIDAKVHRPGVGQNLQDHLELYIQARCKEPITLARYWSLWSKAWIGANWLFLKRGLGCSNHFESAAFIRSQAGVDYPDIQYHFLPLAVRYDGGGSVEGHGFQCHVGPMRSKARGAVSLRSNNPFEAPRIVFNYLTAEDDLALFRQCITLTRELYRQKAFAPYYDSELLPGAHVKTDAELDHFIRDHVESAYHPSGSCRMGESADQLAVVDELTQVMGVHNLRVVDSSIFPRITNGNLNAPSIMVAEKAADHILGRTPLPQVHSSVWIHPHWQTKQR